MRRRGVGRRDSRRGCRSVGVGWSNGRGIRVFVGCYAVGVGVFGVFACVWPSALACSSRYWLAWRCVAVGVFVPVGVCARVAGDATATISLTGIGMLSEPLDRRTCSWAPFQGELQAQEGVAADFCRRSSGCEVDPVGLLVLRSRSSQEDEGCAACARGSDATVEVLIANDAGAVLVIVLLRRQSRLSDDQVLEQETMRDVLVVAIAARWRPVTTGRCCRCSSRHWEDLTLKSRPSTWSSPLGIGVPAAASRIPLSAALKLNARIASMDEAVTRVSSQRPRRLPRPVIGPCPLKGWRT